MRGVGAVLACFAVVAALPARSLAVLLVDTSAAPSFTDNLDAGDQTQAFQAVLDVKNVGNDTGLGWDLTITSTQYSSGASAETLPTTATQITSVTSACANPPCVPAANSVALPVTVPAGGVPPAPVSFFDAAENTGQGHFTVTPSFQVNVPENSFAGVYTSTLTFAIISGP